MTNKKLLIAVSVIVLLLVVTFAVSGARFKRSAAACNDGLDNDGDTKIDYPSDTGCSSKRDKSEQSTIQCDNGLDDDGDGLTDWPSDSGCASLTDNSETTPSPPTNNSSGGNSSG